MSITSELSRIKTAKTNIINSIRNKGVRVNEIASLSDLNLLIDQIQSAKPEQSKDIRITKNGSFNVSPDIGNVLSSVNILAEVQAEGIQSQFSEIKAVEFTTRQMYRRSFSEFSNLGFTRQNLLGIIMIREEEDTANESVALVGGFLPKQDGVYSPSVYIFNYGVGSPSNGGKAAGIWTSGDTINIAFDGTLHSGRTYLILGFYGPISP